MSWTVLNHGLAPVLVIRDGLNALSFHSKIATPQIPRNNAAILAYYSPRLRLPFALCCYVVISIVMNDTQTKPKAARTSITRRIHINPQSKGNLGRNFEAEFRTAWLDRLGVPWIGSALDDRHRIFSSRHPEAVRSYQLGAE